MNWIAMFLAAGVATAAFADRPATVVPATEQAAYRTWLSAEAIHWEAQFALAEPCPSATVTDISTTPFKVSAPPESIAGDGLAEAVRVEGCGRQSRQNFYVYRLKNGSGWTSGPGFPGESKLTHIMQTQIMTQARQLLAMQAPANCDLRDNRRLGVGELSISVKPGLVHILEPGQTIPKASDGEVPDGIYMNLPSPQYAGRLDEARAWQERWPFTVCGKPIEVFVMVLPLKNSPGGEFIWLLQLPTTRAI